MLDTIADIRARLGTCHQRDADAATLLGIVDSYAGRLNELLNAVGTWLAAVEADDTDAEASAAVSVIEVYEKVNGNV